MERSILELPFSKLCAVPLPLQNRALSREKEGQKGAKKRGGRGAASQRGKKEKRTREKRSAYALTYTCACTHMSHILSEELEKAVAVSGAS